LWKYVAVWARALCWRVRGFWPSWLLAAHRSSVVGRRCAFVEFLAACRVRILKNTKVDFFFDDYPLSGPNVAPKNQSGIEF
jgi:hypothetical protein